MIGVEKEIGLAAKVAERAVEERSFAMDLLSEFKKTNKRMFIIILVLIGVLVASNFYWLYTFTQYDFVSYETTTDGGGNANILHGDGDINNGESNSKN